MMLSIVSPLSSTAQRMARLVTGLSLLLVALTLTAPPLLAQDLSRFANPSGTSKQQLDHAFWDGFLQRYVQLGSDGITRLDYNQAQSELAALQAYLDDLSAQTPSQFGRDEAMAYWINFYNALTVKVVLENYPLRSIRQIDGLLGFGGPWKRPRVSVEGQSLSLDNMEHGILRPGFGDPRVHYAVNCASYSCPNLMPRAFTAANLDQQLEVGAHDYINHDRGVSLSGGRLQVSSIYHWFQEDFGGSDAGVIAHLRQYAEGPLADGLASVQRIAGHHYDWALNDSQ